MEEKELFTDDEVCAGKKEADCPEDDGADLSLDNTSPEELDQLWDDADDDEPEPCVSKKKRDRMMLIIGAVIAGITMAAAAYFTYKLVKSRKKGD